MAIVVEVVLGGGVSGEYRKERRGSQTATVMMSWVRGFAGVCLHFGAVVF